MKVISPGPKWKIQKTCTGAGNGDKGCEAELEIERPDLRFFAAREGYMRDFSAAVVFKCPCCGLTTDLACKEWPINHEQLEPWTSDWRDERV